MIPLFEHYPLLATALPFISLGHYPTPVLHAPGLDVDRRSAGITVKHDGVTGKPYGGNKVRKLEFLLAEAQAKGKTDVLTFGGAGSNHALATAIYADKLGMKPHSLLIRQPNSHALRNNLLRALGTGAHLQHFESKAALAAAAMLKTGWSALRRHSSPFLIPPGGSSPLGVLGYVNAAFELKRQIDTGELDRPDVIYVASGTMGTCVGLALGFRLLGLNPSICAVAVTGTDFSSMARAKKLFDQANSLLINVDSSIPRFDFDVSGLVLRHDFFGGEYGRYTTSGIAAINQFKEATGLAIEGCYTGKCVAALLDDLQEGKLDQKHVLFWNTYDAIGSGHIARGTDYRELPRAFHGYFEHEVQEFDRGGVSCGASRTMNNS